MSKYNSIVIKNARIVTVNPDHDVFQGDVFIIDDQIVSVGRVDENADVKIDATNLTLVPGFVQTHVHLCQVLLRNTADDLSLLEWLKKRILPMEAAHDPESLSSSARLGLAELIKSGTTTILDMGTVHHHDVVFTEIENSGIRAFSGKCMMDAGNAPPAMIQTTDQAISESMVLAEKWHGRANGRIHYALAPRFALSCTEQLLKKTGELARTYGFLLHTHAAENRAEIAYLNQKKGLGNIEYFNHLDLLNPKTLLAHCIWLSAVELELLARSGTRVMHCPSANLKLGSGIAMVPEMLNQGILISLGADGAPCNNNLDIFIEMRLAALIQNFRKGPGAIGARTIFDMATINGARALGLDHLIGSIEIGKKADLVLLDTRKLHNNPANDIYGQLVYSCKSGDVRTVIVDGKILMQDGILVKMNEEAIVVEAEKQRKRIQEKIE